MSKELDNLKYLLKHTHFVFYGKDKVEEQIKIYNESISSIEKRLKTLMIINKYFYSKHIIHDLYCLGATDEEIKLVKEVLENDN